MRAINVWNSECPAEDVGALAQRAINALGPGEYEVHLCDVYVLMVRWDLPETDDQRFCCPEAENLLLLGVGSTAADFVAIANEVAMEAQDPLRD